MVSRAMPSLGVRGHVCIRDRIPQYPNEATYRSAVLNGVPFRRSLMFLLKVLRIANRAMNLLRSFDHLSIQPGGRWLPPHPSYRSASLKGFCKSELATITPLVVLLFSGILSTGSITPGTLSGWTSRFGSRYGYCMLGFGLAPSFCNSRHVLRSPVTEKRHTLASSWDLSQVQGPV
nr:hypothetical protein [Tanacetum cinerariifolium]